MLELARSSIKSRFTGSNEHEIDETGIDPELKVERGVFVTLTVRRQLRGCIGHIEAVQPLYLDIIDNALNSAFQDPRFDPLSDEELEQVKIEISVLTVPKDLKYAGPADLLAKLKPLKDGVILKKGNRQATYLPQVWDEIGQKETFLSSLCLKAGLPSDQWEHGDLKIQTYEVEMFEE